MLLPAASIFSYAFAESQSAFSTASTEPIPPTSASSSKFTGSTFSNRSTLKDTARVSADTEHPDEPDLLVLGFQELDLSTEALLYSLGTSREDAWCVAVFAALGERAVRYEKVNVGDR
jgi:phosphatidylinositol-bisphosphatase